MTRPKMYFPSMTTEEVLSYASQYAETELEKALAELLVDALEAGDSLVSEEMLSWELNDAGENLVQSLEDEEEISDELHEAKDTYKDRVNAAYVKHQRG